MSSEPRAGRPLFFYDLASPYAYLAALRVDAVLPVTPCWQPIVFGVILRERGRVPWSLRSDEREPGQRLVDARARERGLAPLRWPPGWPGESYSQLPLRAVVCAAEQGWAAGKALTRALYEIEFGEGRALSDPGTIAEAASRCGLDAAALLGGAESERVRGVVRANTERALALGVSGVPTVALDRELYWGDDRLEDAAAACARRGLARDAG